MPPIEKREPADVVAIPTLVLKYDLPNTSRILPLVVEVAPAPTITTSPVSIGYTAKLSVVVAHGLTELPLPPVESGPHAGRLPPVILRTCPGEHIASLERVPESDA